MKPKISKKMRETLVKACVSMLEHPDRYDQYNPCVPSCRSAGCIYGFIALHDRDFRLGGDIDIDQIAKELGASRFHDISHPIYIKSQWPREYQELFYIAETDLERALVAVGRIRHWLKTGE